MAWTFYEQETLIRFWMRNTVGTNKARAKRFLDSYPDFKYSLSAVLSKVSRLEQNGILDDTLDIVQPNSSNSRGSIRATVSTDITDSVKAVKISKKQDEGVQGNLFKPKNPYAGRCLLNTKIVGDDAPGETWHRLVTSVNAIDGVNVNLCPMPVNNVHQCAAEQHSVETNTHNGLQGHVEFAEDIHHENVCPRSMNNIELNVTKQDHMVLSSLKKRARSKHSSQCGIQLPNSDQSNPSKLPRLHNIDVFASNISTVQLHSIDNTNDGNHVDADTYKIALLLMQMKDRAPTFSS